MLDLSKWHNPHKKAKMFQMPCKHYNQADIGDDGQVIKPELCQTCTAKKMNPLDRKYTIEQGAIACLPSHNLLSYQIKLCLNSTRKQITTIVYTS